MARPERTTRLVRRIPVQDASGTTHIVEEWADFLRVQLNDLTWSEPMRTGGRLILGAMHINPTDDANVLEIAQTGEKLTVIPTSP